MAYTTLSEDSEKNKKIEKKNYFRISKSRKFDIVSLYSYKDQLGLEDLMIRRGRGTVWMEDLMIRRGSENIWMKDDGIAILRENKLTGQLSEDFIKF